MTRTLTLFRHLLAVPVFAWLVISCLLLGSAHAQNTSLVSKEQLAIWGHDVFACFPVVVALVAMTKRAIEHEVASLPNWLAVWRTKFWFYWLVALLFSLLISLSLWSQGYGGQLFLYHVSGIWASFEFAIVIAFLASGGMALLLQLLETLGLTGPRNVVNASPSDGGKVTVELADHASDQLDASGAR